MSLSITWKQWLIRTWLLSSFISWVVLLEIGRQGANFCRLLQNRIAIFAEHILRPHCLKPGGRYGMLPMKTPWMFLYHLFFVSSNSDGKPLMWLQQLRWRGQWTVSMQLSNGQCSHRQWVFHSCPGWNLWRPTATELGPWKNGRMNQTIYSVLRKSPSFHVSCFVPGHVLLSHGSAFPGQQKCSILERSAHGQVARICS